MKILINYAHRLYKKAQIKNCVSAFETGEFDCVIKYKFEDIDQTFYNKNKHILDKERGAGYWLWKPYIIKKTMLEKMNEDDVLFYCDAGHTFYNSANFMIDIMEKTEQKFLVTTTSQIEKKWTKRDTFYYMGCDEKKYYDAIQAQATYIVLKKNNFTLNLIDEWLTFSQDYRLITDSKNECGLDNFLNFQDHRHDQSILSLLCTKYGVKSIIPPDQYNFYNPNKEIPLQIIIYSGRHNTD